MVKALADEAGPDLERPRQMDNNSPANMALCGGFVRLADTEGREYIAICGGTHEHQTEFLVQGGRRSELVIADQFREVFPTEASLRRRLLAAAGARRAEVKRRGGAVKAAATVGKGVIDNMPVELKLGREAILREVERRVPTDSRPVIPPRTAAAEVMEAWSEGVRDWTRRRIMAVRDCYREVLGAGPEVVGADEEDAPF